MYRYRSGFIIGIKWSVWFGFMAWAMYGFAVLGLFRFEASLKP